MDDVSLMPLEHQLDFENASFVPVDHDPFSTDGVTQQAPAQQAQGEPAQTQSGQRVQPQPTQVQPQSQSQPQPVLSAWPKPTVSGDSSI